MYPFSCVCVCAYVLDACLCVCCVSGMNLNHRSESQISYHLHADNLDAAVCQTPSTSQHPAPVRVTYPHDAPAHSSHFKELPTPVPQDASLDSTRAPMAARSHWNTMQTGSIQ